MFSTIISTFGLVAAASAIGVSITPHDKFSSSIGVLGCYINTNRVAYFPGFPSCGNYCLEVTANGRTVNLLHIDQSGGAYDISYDAWNYLYTGVSAQVQPEMGGGIPADYKVVGMDKCSGIISEPNGKLALTAANAVNTYLACPESFSMYNIANQVCTLGDNTECTLDLNVSNQPSCGDEILGVQTPLNMGDKSVKDIAYGTGKLVAALQ